MPDDDITTIYKEDEAYPEMLRQIADPPEQLYCRGDIGLLNTFCFAVVGTRRASDYGRQACRDIVSMLAGHGLTIVSGLAAGIDAEAHRATLNVQGKTIAVFGTGVDDASIFPAENVRLAHDIIASGGLLVSELKPGTPGLKWTFPMRNRIISGLSRGVLVVEADRQSGSLITAQSALDQNRDVFAVPGSIYWPRSVGSNELIQQGARPVMTGADILQSYQLRQVALPSDGQDVSTQDPVQEKILAILKDSGPTHLDTVAVRAEYETPRVMAAIALLELHGYIRHQGAGIYQVNGK